MGEVISEAKLLDPRNRARVEQAISLIFRGKAGIAGQDPALRPFVNALVLKGVTSAQEINRRIQVQKQEEIKAQTFAKVSKVLQTQTQKEQALRTIFEGPTVGNNLRRFIESEKTQGISEDLTRRLIEKTRPAEQQQVFKEVGLKDFGKRVKFFEGLSRGSQRETERLLAKKDLTRNEKASLMAIQFALPAVQLVQGLKQLPAFAKSIVKNPKNIKKVPKQIWRGLKETGLEIYALARVDPRLAVARIGGEIVVLLAIGEAFKVVGKVGKGAFNKVSPNLKRVRGGRVVVKSTGKGRFVKIKVASKKTIKLIEKKSKLAKKVVKKAKKIKKKVKAVKKVQAKEIRQFKTAVEYSKQLKKARQARKLARKKGRTISIGNNDYVEAVAFVEEAVDRLATSKAKQFIKTFKARGGKLGLGQKESFIKAVRSFANKQLNKLSDFKNLKNYAKLKRPFQIKLLKAKKINPATKLIKTISSKVKKFPITKKIKSLATKIKRIIKKKVKAVKKVQAKEIRQFKTAVEYSKQLKKARQARKLARKKGRTISIGNNDYVEAVAFVEEAVDRLATSKAKQFIKTFKARGGKLGLGQKESFIKAVRSFANKQLNKLSDFKNLKNYAKLKRPFQIKLLKAKKINPATKLIKTISSKVKKFPITKKIKSLATKIKKLPAKIKKGLVKRKLQRIGRKEFRETIRYKMEKARPIRKVTLQQLEKSSTISRMNKFVDRFFDEVGRRQKINISSVKYRQFKNLIKKRLRRAIKTGNKVEINKFKRSIKKIIDDMNKPSSKPSVKVISTGKKRITRTIKDFSPEVKKGEFVEVRSGQQVLLQRTKQIQKVKPIQKLAIQKQVFVIQTVQKKSISLLPLVRYVSSALADFFIRSLVKQKIKRKPGQAITAFLKVKQKDKAVEDAKEDLKTLQKTFPEVKVTQTTIQDIISQPRFRPIQKVKPEPPTKKKPTARRKRKRPVKPTKKKIREIGYVSSVKKKTQTKLHTLPLTKERALDILAYNLDKTPSIKGRTIKSLKKVRRSILQRQIRLVPKGYFLKHRKKFVLKKLRKGRETYEMIEKKKFRKDSKKEKRVKRRPTTSRRIKRK